MARQRTVFNAATLRGSRGALALPWLQAAARLTGVLGETLSKSLCYVRPDPKVNGGDFRQLFCDRTVSARGFLPSGSFLSA